MTAPLLDQPLRNFLRPAERALIAWLGRPSPEALLDWLDANPSADHDGIRRDALMALIEPQREAGLRSLLPEDSRDRPTVGAAPPDTEWQPIPAGYDRIMRQLERSLALAEGRDAGPQDPAALPDPQRQDVVGDLIGDAWPVRSQHGNPACVAFATNACLELRQARRTSRRPSHLSSMFLYGRMRDNIPASPPPGWADGATRLGQAIELLASEGTIMAEAWPDDRPAGTPLPSAIGLPRLRAVQKDYALMPLAQARPERVAARIYDLLAQGLPVAISLPLFADPKQPEGATDWQRRFHVRTGEVPDPAPRAVARRGAGHAVCVVGFQPSSADPIGGYFVFRNSWGTRWGASAPNGHEDDAPFVPQRGYGTISAAHVEAHCWELLALDLA